MEGHVVAGPDPGGNCKRADHDGRVTRKEFNFGSHVSLPHATRPRCLAISAPSAARRAPHSSGELRVCARACRPTAD